MRTSLPAVTGGRGEAIRVACELAEETIRRFWRCVYRYERTIERQVGNDYRVVDYGGES